MYVSLSEAGGIYFITFPSCSDFVKIGKAVCFSNRFAGLQTGSPHLLNVELIFPVNVLDSKGLYEVENMFHSKFSSFRHRGEWFVKSGELARFIEERQAQEPASSCCHTDAQASQVYGWDHSVVNKQPIEIEGFDTQKMLSNRETTCAIYVSEGHNNDEIAELMCVGKETIKTFITNSLQKLGLKNRTQLAAEVVRRGWS